MWAVSRHDTGEPISFRHNPHYRGGFLLVVELDRPCPGRVIVDALGLDIPSEARFKWDRRDRRAAPCEKSASTGIRRVTIGSIHAENNHSDAWAKFDGRSADQINNGIE
jgi:hypothetical protein